MRRRFRLCADRLACLPREDGGMFSILHLYVTLLFLIFFSLLLNVASAMAEKVSAQNAADSSAVSAATVLARAMNATTAVHHLTGELNALVVLHHALGGYDLDGESDPYDPSGEARLRQQARDYQQYVELAYDFASFSPASPPPFMGNRLPQEAKDGDPVGATIRDARNRLRLLLAVTYVDHGIGGWMQISVWPPTVAAGNVMVWAAYLMEMKIYQELVFLKLVEKAARAARGAKKMIERTLIPGLQVYLRLLRIEGPAAAATAAQEIAEQNGAEGALYPPLLGVSQRLALPLQMEKDQLTTNWSLLARSQIVRASWPWVQEWRRPIRTVLAVGATLSGASGHYKRWSETYTLRKSRQFKERVRPSGHDLHVLLDCDVTQQEKGNEPWAKASGGQRADELFCVLGFARQFPFRSAPAVYDQPNPDGVVAFAQAMVYNANPQRGGRQPVLGWDTLNWSAPAPDFPSDGGTPSIQLNWQAKLVPATRIDEAEVRLLPGAIGDVLRRTPPGLAINNTH